MSLILIFILIGGFSYEEQSQNISFPFFYNALQNVSKDYIVGAMGTENPYFAQDLTSDQKPPSLSQTTFQLATNIKPGDVKSLIGLEIPGFDLYNPHSIVSEKGTNVSSQPVKPVSPMKDLTKDKSQPKQGVTSNTQSSKIPTPSKKTVLIYHTHSWESFLPLLKGVTQPNQAVSSTVNVSLIGERMVTDFAKDGIGAYDDKTNMTKLLSSQGLNYNSAYKMSRTLVKKDEKKFPNLQYFFDVHRDSSRGNVTKVTINSKPYARVAFVIGKSNPNYEKNLAMAITLHNLLEKDYPGLSRGVLQKDKTTGNGIYNQDLSPHDLLIEVGGVDNNKTELDNTADALTKVIETYMKQQSNQ